MKYSLQHTPVVFTTVLAYASNHLSDDKHSISQRHPCQLVHLLALPFDILIARCDEFTRERRGIPRRREVDSILRFAEVSTLDEDLEDARGVRDVNKVSELAFRPERRVGRVRFRDKCKQRVDGLRLVYRNTA